MAGIKLRTITLAIKALSITMQNSTALKILDEGEIPESATNLGAVLFPKPDGFITNLTVTPQTYGTGGSERMDVAYNMTYVFADIPGGAGRSLAGNYDTLVYDAVQILNSLATNDAISDGVDLRISNIPSFGVVYDPGGRAYYGTEIELAVTEFYEV